ncbi:MAG: ATP-binding cassette domain-containing protein [Clostridiaceae bacterium]|nr:ATP-binding cassette domain-containing protein [Clostridiaceae bacterium]
MNAIHIEGLKYAYPDDTLALDNISLSIPEKKKVAILGHNGSGKSTLLQHLNGLILPQTGLVEIMGSPVTKKNIEKIRKSVGIVFDNPEDQLFSTTVYDDIAFGPRNLGYCEKDVQALVEKAMNLVGIEDLQHRPPYNLSLGQKKKAAIAGVLAMEPNVLIFDEPFSGLDPYSHHQFLVILKTLHQQGHTLIITTHDVDMAYRWGDECIILNQGKVLAQGPTTLLENKELMKKAKLKLPSLYSIFEKTSLKPHSVREAKSLLDALLKDYDLLK